MQHTYKDRATRILLKTDEVPAPHVVRVVLLINDTNIS